MDRLPEATSDPAAGAAASPGPVFDLVADLPGALTPLIGRDRLLDDVCDLLRDPAVRLVTLLGPGGVGKTRLAIEIGTRLRDERRGGVRFAQLAGITDPSIVLPAIARALGLRETGNRPLRERLRDELAERDVLLVLDNFEQVLAAAPEIASLLAESHGFQVLITSRARLGVRGERIITVPPLDLPSAEGRTASLLESGAIQLLIARASESNPDYTPTSDEVGALAEICRRLDGLPLAIELIAARLRLLPAPALLARLERRLPLLTSGPRDLPARQRTLRDAIGWTYDLLTPEEQTLFRRLSVFAGGFSLAAAEQIGGGVERVGATSGAPPLATLDGLGGLVDWSLLLRVDSLGAASDEPRFTMLETVREFGLERLADAGEEAAARARHADYYASLAAHAAARLTGPDQALWLERLDADHDNLRAALAWLTANGERDGALALAAGLWLYWRLRGHLAEGRRRLAEVLDGPASDTPAYISSLIGAGALAEAQGELSAAVVHLDDAIARARALDDPRLLGDALLFRGIAAFDLNERPLATRCCEESLALAERTGNEWSAGIALAQLGLVATRAGAHDHAEATLRRSLERFRALGNRWGIAVATGGLGILALDRGDPDRAAALLAESLALFQANGDRWGVASYLEGAARAAAARGQVAEAARLFGAASALREAIGIDVKRVYRSSYDLQLETIRTSLGEALFARAWEEGRALSSTQAVAAALRSADSAPGPRPSETAPARASEPAAKVAPPPPAVSLTPREREVLALLAEGQSDREIGHMLMIGHRTVATHVTNILNKLGVNSRTAAATSAVRLGLV